MDFGKYVALSGFFYDHLGMGSDNLLRVAQRYASTKGVELSTLATYAAGDSRFFARLRDGRVTIRRADAVARWISDHWPDHLEWPPDVPRPEPTAECEAKEVA